MMNVSFLSNTLAFQIRRMLLFKNQFRIKSKKFGLLLNYIYNPVMNILIFIT